MSETTGDIRPGLPTLEPAAAVPPPGLTAPLPHLSEMTFLLLQKHIPGAQSRGAAHACRQAAQAEGWALRGQGLPCCEASARVLCKTMHLPGVIGPEASKLNERSCQHDSWGSSSFSTLSRKAAVLSAQGHIDGMLCLFQSIFLHNPHTSQGTQHRDFDDYYFLLLFCGINCPQDLTNNIFFPPTLTKLDRKLKASKLLSSSLCQWRTIWKGTSHTGFPVV